MKQYLMSKQIVPKDATRLYERVSTRITLQQIFVIWFIR
jgi:hypothetical protein